MKYFTLFVLYTGILLSGIFTLPHATTEPVIANRELCFLACTSIQPLAAIENQGAFNLILKPNDQGSHQKKALNYIAGKAASNSFGRSRMKYIICFLSGKSVNLFWIGNTSLSLLNVFRC